MSSKKIIGIILVILGLIGAYYYIGGYFEVKSQFGNVFGVADETLKNYWPMMAASIAVLALGIFLIFKGDDQASGSNINSTPIQPSTITSINFNGDKTLANDSYKIFLVKKYGIEKNDALGKIICQGMLFDDTDQALKHAAEIDGPKSGSSTPSNITHPADIQKALSANENTDNKSPLISDDARRLGITHDGSKYCYKTYQYDQLDDALKFARNDIQSASITKQDESPSSNKKIIAIVVGVIVIIGGYFALQKNSCSDAKADVIRWMNVYTTSLYQGKQGMSVPGAAEAITALEIAKKACNKPDLTVEEIINPQATSSKPNVTSSTKSSTTQSLIRFSFGDLSLDNNELLFNGKQMNPKITGNNFTYLQKEKLPNSGEVILLAEVGGNACPYMFTAIVFNDANNYKASNPFGTCSDIYTFKVIDGIPTLTTKDMNTGDDKVYALKSLISSSSNQISPSFDCSKAKSTSEKLICSDSQLAKEDNQLSELYKSAKLKAKDPAAFKAMTTAAWKEREANCFDKACLLKWYAGRKIVYQNIINGAQ
jgi:uncharacterized protein YecT (DUF1311 family)